MLFAKLHIIPEGTKELTQKFKISDRNKIVGIRRELETQGEDKDQVLKTKM